MGFDAGVESAPRPIYTGLVDMQVIAINPTLEQAAKLGITLREEPVYATIDEETKTHKLRLDIWLKAAEIQFPIKLAIFLEDVDQMSSTSKARFINDFGQNSYAEDAEALVNLLSKSKGLKWFKADGIRIAKKGECEMIEFIRAWMSISMESKSKFDSFTNLCKGNVKELTDILAKYPTRKVQLLLTAKEADGKWFQNVYARFFQRSGSTNTSYWKKQLDGQTTKPIYQESFKLKVFDPLSYEADDESTSKEDVDNPWAK